MGYMEMYETRRIISIPNFIYFFNLLKPLFYKGLQDPYFFRCYNQCCTYRIPIPQKSIQNTEQVQHFSQFLCLPFISPFVLPGTVQIPFFLPVFFAPTYSTKLHMGFLSISLILFMPILEYSAASLKMMSDKLSNTSLTTETMFMNLHEQHAIVYDKEFITTEPVKKMNEAYKAFKVQCPATIPRQAQNVD